MNDVLSVSLNADTGSFITGFKSAEQAQDAFLRKVVGSSNYYQQAEAAIKRMALAVTGAGVGMVAFFGSAGKAAADFYGSMRNVNTIAKESESGFRAMGQSVLDMSKTLPQSAQTLSEGLYDVVSTGYQGADALNVLHVSAEAASAGLSDTGTAGRAIMGVLKAYGMEASQAGFVSDVLFQTVNAGVITFQELAQGMSAWVPIAASAKIPIQDASAALATMTLAGIPAAEANTALARTMISLIDPSDSMTQALHSMGFESGSAAISALGFKGVMDQLFQITGGNIEAMRALFPRIEGLQGALALGAANGQNYADVMAMVADKSALAGATQKALDEQMKGVPMQLQVLVNSFQAFRIELGSYLEPVFGKILHDLIGMMSVFSDIPPPILGLIGLIGTFSGVLVALGGVFLLLQGKSLLMKYAIGQFNGAIGTTIKPVGSVIQLLSQLVAWLINKVAPGYASAAAAAVKASNAFSSIKVALPAIAAAAFAIIDLTGEIHSAQQAADQYVESLRSSSDLTTLQGLTDYRNELHKQGVEVENNIKAYSGLATGWEVLKLAMPFMDSGLEKQQEKLSAITDEIHKVDTQYRLMGGNLDILTHSLGMNADQVSLLAGKLKVDLTQATSANTDAIKNAADAAGLTKGQFQELAKAAHGSSDEFWGTAKALGVTDTVMQHFGASLASGVGPMTSMGNAQSSFASIADNAAQAQNGLQLALGNMITQLLKGKDAMNVGAGAAKQDEVALQNMANAAMGLSDQEVKLTDTQKALNDAIASIGSPLQAFSDALDQKKENVKDWGQKALDAGQITQTAFDNMQKGVHLSLDEYAASLEAQNLKLLAWKQDTLTVTARVGTDVATYIAAMGDKGVDLMHQMATGSDDETQRMKEAILTNINNTGSAAGPEMEAAMNIVTAAARAGGKASADAIATELGIGVNTVKGIGAQYGQSILDGVNPILLMLGKPPIEIAFFAPHDRGTASGSGHFMAQGGYLPDQATFMPAQPGAGLVQWAEPETGGEWFIPAGKAKRKRSTKILGDVAKSFGYDLVQYADGGVFGQNPVTGGPVPKFPSAGFPFPSLAELVTEANWYGYTLVNDAFISKLPDDQKSQWTDENKKVLAAYSDELLAAKAKSQASHAESTLWSLYQQKRSLAANSKDKSPEALFARYLMSRSKFASGGFMNSNDVPPPPLAEYMHHGQIGQSRYEGDQVIYDTVRKWIDATVPIAKVPGGTVRNWLVAAINATGSPMAWLPPLYDIAMFESGGNPNAINLSDSNAAAGHPSKGLMQTIDSTFSSYAMPGHMDIYNPVDNAIAAIRYIIARYGTPFNTPGERSRARGGPYMGYSLGGFLSDQIKTFDSGGTLSPGLNIVYNGTKAPEHLVRADGVGGGATGVNINRGAIMVEVRADAGVDSGKFEAAVRNAVEPAMQAMARGLTKQFAARSGRR